jgi:hypothetical protein
VPALVAPALRRTPPPCTYCHICQFTRFGTSVRFVLDPNEWEVKGKLPQRMLWLGPCVNISLAPFCGIKSAGAAATRCQHSLRNLERGQALAILQLRQLSCTQHTSRVQLQKFNRSRDTNRTTRRFNEILPHHYLYVSFCELMSSGLHQKRTRTNRLQRWSICCCLQPEYRQRCNRQQELEWGNDHSDHWWRQIQDQEWKRGCDRTQWHHVRQRCLQLGLHASQVDVDQHPA